MEMEPRRMLCFLLSSLISPVMNFQCYTCNGKSNIDETQPCVDEPEPCPDGINSCSMAIYRPVGQRRDQRAHVRKFCTSPGTTVYEYLLLFPSGGALCQNVHTPDPPTTSGYETLNEEYRPRRSRAMPPAPPPTERTRTLLCVCSEELCNGGTATEMITRTMLNELDEVGGYGNPAAGATSLQDLKRPCLNV